MNSSFRRPALAALALCFAFLPLLATGAQTFEGTLSLSIVSTTVTSEAQGYMLGQSFTIRPRTTVVAVEGIEGGYPIIDFAAGKFMIVSPKDKYYLTLPLGQLTAPIDKVAVTPKKTGRTDVILGHPVEEFALDDAATKFSYRMWATRDFKAAFNFYLSLQKTAPNEGLVLGRMAKAVIALGYFPMGAAAKNDKGVQTLEMRVLSMEAGKPDATLFAVPAGYGKMSDMLKKKK